MTRKIAFIPGPGFPEDFDTAVVYDLAFVDCEVVAELGDAELIRTPEGAFHVVSK